MRHQPFPTDVFPASNNKPSKKTEPIPPASCTKEDTGPLLITFRPSKHLKTHMLIKPFFLRVLLIHRQLIDTISIHPISQQRLPQSPAPLFVRNEQHFQFPSVNPHKSVRLQQKKHPEEMPFHVSVSVPMKIFPKFIRFLQMPGLINLRLPIRIPAAAGQYHPPVVKTYILDNRKLIIRHRMG